MWTSIISNTNRSSQCNCSPIAVLHTEDVVRLPKTCFSLVETGSSLVISKPLIFYKYECRSEICFWVGFSENHFEIGKELLCICEQALSLNLLPLFFFSAWTHTYSKVVWSCSSTGAAVPGMGINIIIRCMYPPWTLPTLSQPIPLRRLVVASEEWGKNEPDS